MMTTRPALAPTARTIDAIDAGLLALNADLGTVSAEVYLISRDAMYAGVRGATMHLRLGRIERAAAILDGMRDDLWTVGLPVK